MKQIMTTKKQLLKRRMSLLQQSANLTESMKKTQSHWDKQRKARNEVGVKIQEVVNELYQKGYLP